MEGRIRRQSRLPASRTSAGLARAELRRLLEEAGHQEWLDRAELALSEVVTNALVHAGGEVDLELCVDDDRLRVEVGDGSPHVPAPRDYAPLAGTGRGLHIVDELVDAWDVQPRSPGKVVWFELRSPTSSGRDPEEAQALDPAGPEGDPPASRADTVRVELRNFPLLMHAAWQEHASSLLRERLLFGDDPEEDGRALLAHASASDAMNLLFEQVPRLPQAESPDAIMVTATEPRVSVDRLEVEMPASSVSHFETLEALLTEASSLADAGELLVPPTQPEIRAFRRWVCAQVRRQTSVEAEPEAWSSHPRPVRDPEDGNLDWDPTPVGTSSRALLAADDAGRVVAVSQAALTLLGYTEAGRLCGQRLLQIVPERYHQAHVAGLTMHTTNGRDPLLGTPVTVPAVRADGSETEVDLLVEVEHLPSGRRVFVAEFSAPGSRVRR